MLKKADILHFLGPKGGNFHLSDQFQHISDCFLILSDQNWFITSFVTNKRNMPLEGRASD